jgi:hypothetical protein
MHRIDDREVVLSHREAVMRKRFEDRLFRHGEGIQQAAYTVLSVERVTRREPLDPEFVAYLSDNTVQVKDNGHLVRVTVEAVAS